jgi:hypothetical protein
MIAAIDRCFDNFERAVKVLRDHDIDDLADTLEKDFIVHHDRAMRNLAALSNALRLNDREQAEAHNVFYTQALGDMAASAMKAYNEVNRLRAEGKI